MIGLKGQISGRKTEEYLRREYIIKVIYFVISSPSYCKYDIV